MYLCSINSPTTPPRCSLLFPLFFFFNDPATPDIYTLSLHDALPISPARLLPLRRAAAASTAGNKPRRPPISRRAARSEEHTSELQSRGHLVCRLLLEKKKKYIKITPAYWT